MVKGIYSQLRYYEINPDTGVSVLFDKNHFVSNRYMPYYKALPTGNFILKRRLKEIVSLAAYGINAAKAYDILKVSFEELEDITKTTYCDHVPKCIVYYSEHLDELFKLVGNFEATTEQLIDAYVKGTDGVKVTSAVPTEADMRIAVNKVLNYAYTEIPDIQTTKEINEKEKAIKNAIMVCNNKEVLNELFTELSLVLEAKEEYNKNVRNIKNYKAVRDMTDTGVVKACQMWLRLHPDF